MDLDSMNYAELRRLAKEAGFKANVKADKLRKALKQHYEVQQEREETNLSRVSGGVVAQVDTMESEDVDEPVMDTAVFVTKRRGRRSKRKNPGDADTECEPNVDVVLPLCPFDKFVEKAPDSETGAEIGSAKRRRLSSVQDSGMSGSTEDTKEAKDETQPDNTGAVPVSSDEGEKKVAKAGRIPRHKALLNRTKPALKPTTPNFKKLHEAHFNKMESIHSYVQRKTKQMEVYKNSVKELKSLSDKTISEPTDGQTQVKSSKNRATLFSPAPVDKKTVTDKRRHTQLAANKPAVQRDSVPFKPSVLSTRRINVRFSEATQSNEPKRTLVKTPARMSSVVNNLTPGKETNVRGKSEMIKTSALSSTKTPGSTFVFNGNTTISNTPGTNKKSAFDLKASLSRPLSYKPHKGKLKPFEPTQENSVGSTSQITQAHQKNFKQHQVQTREERRMKHQEDRKQKKENMLGARRGLIMT